MFGNFQNNNMMMFGLTGNMGNMGHNVNQGMNMNINQNQNDIMGLVYGSGQNINQSNQSSFMSNKTNIIFKATSGLNVTIPIDLNKTISDAILLYLRRVNREKLFKKNSGILFLHNARVIDIYDRTTIGEFFGQFLNPFIIVNDVKNLIGAFKI